MAKDEKYGRDPVGWVREVVGAEPWETQSAILEAVRDHGRVTVRSCHGVGKSWTAACAALWFLYTRDPALVLTTAPTHRQVKEVLWRRKCRCIAGGEECFEQGPAKPGRRGAYIEDYLDQVFAPLVDLVPYSRRLELRAELGDHIQSLADAYEELGMSGEVAAARAVEQLGEPREVGQRWRCEWAKTLRRPMPLMPAVRAVAPFWIAATLLSLPLIGSDRAPGLVFPVVVVLPIVTGLLAGYFAPSRRVFAGFLVASGLAFVALLAGVLGSNAPDNHLVALGVGQSLGWLPLGATATMAGGWLRKRLGVAPTISLNWKRQAD